jgi:hypothetical protein
MPPTCAAGDQDPYVYNPARLQVFSTCLRVTGVISAVRTEADGDLHILLNLDPEFAYLLRPANQGVELGDLVIEPVCVRPVTQADAIAICASDPDPLAGPFPVVGNRVWMEGRYVLDLDHGGWAELHPLNRWGGDAVVPTETSTATPTSTQPGPTETATGIPTNTQPAPPASLSIAALSGTTNPEYVTITNSGGTQQDMTGWYLVSVVGPQTYHFPAGYMLAAGGSVQVQSYTNATSNPPAILLWSTGPIWNNNGDKAELRTNAGVLVDSQCYAAGCP